MTAAPIWIFTDEVWQPVAKRIVAHLEARGVDSIVIDEATVKGVTVSIGGAGVTVSLDGAVREAPGAALFLRLPIPAVPDSLPAEAVSFHRAQWSTMVRGLLLAWHEQGIPVLNTPTRGLLEEKTAQLARAARVGFTVPDTLHTATPGPVPDFAATHELSVVAMKPFAPFMRVTEDGARVERLLTNLINPDVLADGLANSRVPAPTIVQRVVEAGQEHRIVVVGDQVFGASTDRAGLDGIDVRRSSVNDMPVESSALPDSVRQRFIDLVRESGLAMASLDVLQTETDWVFLELNPMGHFLWVEQLTGQPICAAVADLLRDGGCSRG